MNPAERQALERQALDYLAGQLGPRAPRRIMFEGAFDERPVDDEGRVGLFSFELPDDVPCPPAPSRDPGPRISVGFKEPEAPRGGQRHYVAVGETEPNYFPAYGLRADDAYSFHLGTRYMLRMEVRRVEEFVEPRDARERLIELLRQHARGAPVTLEPAAFFDCDQQCYGVYRARVGTDDYYAIGADCPPGFYRLTQYPPQTALRLHLGKLLRAEARG